MLFIIFAYTYEAGGLFFIFNHDIKEQYIIKELK